MCSPDIDDILKKSTAKIAPRYFDFPVAGLDYPIYRERVYCYELYHQMRKTIGDETRYVLCGEVDKASHPVVRGSGLDDLKPDFLIHEPGNMDANLLIIEVKPATARMDRIGQDVQTLNRFCHHAHYRRAILLVYGENAMGAVPGSTTHEMQAALGEAEFWVHTAAGEEAYRIA